MKVALLHRHTPDRIKETNAAFPYLKEKGMDVLTFKKFNRLGGFTKFWKSLAWIFYAPSLVWGKGYDVIYCDDSYPFYPALVKLVSPKSRVVLRIGDFHLMYNYKGLVYHFLHALEVITWNMADGIIAISHAMAQEISSKTKTPVWVVDDPIDPKDFPMCKSRGRGVMFHGVLTRNKNVDLLIEAAKRLPMVEFSIVGDGPDAERLNSIRPSNVKMHGWIPFNEIHTHIQACAVGVALRSNNPGNEYVVTSPFLQYGIMGKPCLVTRRKVFGDYPWQFKDVDEMVDKLVDLLCGRPDSKKLREFFIREHGAEQKAEEIWQILTQA